MLTLNDLFDLSQTEHAKLFDGVKYPWEVLLKLKEYAQGKKIIGAGTVIEDGAVIKDNVIIGKNCTIRHGAYLRENTVIGDNVTVGQSSELKNCLVFNAVEIPHLNYVGDSILGYKSHLGAGAIISNVKVPKSEIIIKDGERVYKTGLVKFGALIGDHVQIGCNAVVNPGSLIGKNCVLYPLVCWRGILKPDLIVKLRQNQEIAALSTS